MSLDPGPSAGTPHGAGSTDRDSSTRREPALAWGIHTLTASGVVIGVLGLISVLDGHPKSALLWLMLALLIDGIDGPLARHIDIKRACPRVDGYVLDLIVDYVTCVVVPVAFMDRFDLLPNGLNIVLIAAVLSTSAIWMSRTDQETDDNWFNGFPAEWNLVAPSLYLLHSARWVNTVVVLFFCAMTMSSVKFPHPVRVKVRRGTTLTVTIIWLAVMAGLTIVAPDTSSYARVALVAAPGYFLWLSVRRTFDPTFRVDSAPVVEPT